jgi:hypothetical protein
MRLARETQAGLVPATILIGVDSSPDARAEGYLPGANPQRFDAHADFFANSVVDWARQELGVSAAPHSTAVFGVSNGATFAVAIGSLNPHKFGHVLAFSVAKDSFTRAPPRLVPKVLLGCWKVRPRKCVSAPHGGPGQITGETWNRLHVLRERRRTRSRLLAKRIDDSPQLGVPEMKLGSFAIAATDTSANTKGSRMPWRAVPPTGPSASPTDAGRDAIFRNGGEGR